MFGEDEFLGLLSTHACDRPGLNLALGLFLIGSEKNKIINIYLAILVIVAETNIPKSQIVEVDNSVNNRPQSKRDDTSPNLFGVS